MTTEVWDTHACTNTLRWRAIDQWWQRGGLVSWRCQCGDTVFTDAKRQPTRVRPCALEVDEDTRS